MSTRRALLDIEQRSSEADPNAETWRFGREHRYDDEAVHLCDDGQMNDVSQRQQNESSFFPNITAHMIDSFKFRSQVS